MIRINIERVWLTAVSISLFLFASMAFEAAATENEVKIATISLQQVLSSSSSAQAAKKQLEAKLTELNEKIQAEQQKQEGMRAEIEKKSSVWSNEVKQQKEREFLKGERNIKILSEDAKVEFTDYEKGVMNPILIELHKAIAEVGKKNGYTLVFEYSTRGLESKSGLLYADEALDISTQVSEALEKRLAGKKK